MFTKDKSTQNKERLRDLRQELKKRKSLEVDIMNLATGDVYYECPKTSYKFKLDKLGAIESVELDVLATMANRKRGMFENHAITIVDFEDDDFSVEDLLTYLGLKDIYNGIEDTSVDYIDEILKLDNEAFEDMIEKQSSLALIERLAERAIYLYSQKKFDSHSKRRILSKILGVEDIFDVTDAEMEVVESLALK